MRSDLPGQLSFFNRDTAGTPATCLFDGSRCRAEPPTEWMKRLVPNGQYVVVVGEHPLVLQPTGLTENQVPEGHQFYHYQIGGIVYAGIFVGKEATA